jgi:hypothetical protein
MTDLSTNRSAYKLTHEVLQALNSESNVSMIFCDLAKTFDY